MVRGVSSSEKLFIGGDLNGHVGTVREVFERVHGGFGYSEQEDILNFAITYDLMVANTFFRKKKSHLITFSNGQHSSQIDFLLTRREERPNCMDCKVILCECVVTQHKILVADFYFKVCVRRDKSMKIMRTRWWKLKGDFSHVFKNRVITEGSWNEGEDADNMWKEMTTHIRKVAREDLHMIFIDLEKTYDKISRNIMWWALKRKLVPTKYVTLIKDMYTNIVTCVRTCDGESNIFSIKIGLHQGSALSPYIFTLVMDEITKNIFFWCMLFADDVVLINESRIGVNQKLELWR
jgi:Reverse transcriptase (RNA-dependent DNA polymerase)